MTVSAVLHGGSSQVRVSEATRARVREVALNLQYRPNAVARGLSSRRMNTIGVIAQFSHVGDMNLVLHQVLDGILEGSVLAGQRTTIYPVSSWSTDGKNASDFCDGLADGFVLLAPDLNPDVAANLYKAAPIIAVHNAGALAGGLNIEVDNEAGAYAMTTRLLELGHRRIAHIRGAVDRSGSTERLNGYIQALADRGISFDSTLVADGNYSHRLGRDAALEVLGQFRRDKYPTAIFCANDSSAYGAIEAVQSLGLSVPDDISVAGFDSAPIKTSSNIALATVRQPLSAMGAFAVARLLNAIDEELGHRRSARHASSDGHRSHYEVDFEKVKMLEGTALFAPALVPGNSIIDISNRKQVLALQQ